MPDAPGARTDTLAEPPSTQPSSAQPPPSQPPQPPSTQASSTQPPSARSLLRQAGLRVTRPRAMVLEVLLRAEDHLDAADITHRVRDQWGPVSVQAVYNVLETLSQRRLIRRIEPPGRPALFEARVGDNHHHLICRGCGVVANHDCAVDVVPCLRPSQDHDYVIDEAEITWYGRCAACQDSDS